MSKPTDLEEQLEKILREIAMHSVQKKDGTLKLVYEGLTPNEAKQAILDLFQAHTKEVEREAYDAGYDAGENAKMPSLVDAVKFRQEQYGWSDSKMAAMLDLSRPHFSEFKNGKRGLPVNSIRKAYKIGIPAEILLADQLQHPTKEESDDE